MKHLFLFESFDFIKKYDIKPEKGNIGFSEKHQKYFGWSHRAFFGFKVGSKVKVGDCGFSPSNKEEFLDSLKSWYKTDYKDVEYDETAKGVKVTYSFGKSKVRTDEFKPYPKKWGKGAWTAKNLDDAKEMAKAFAESVS